MIRYGAYVKDSIYDSMNFATVVLRRHNCREYQLSRCGSKSTRVPSYDHCISGATLIRESNVVPVLGTLHCWSCYQHYYVSSATLHGRSYIVVTPAWLLLSAATSVVSNCMEDWMWLVWLQLLLRFVLWTLNQWYCIAWKSEPCPNEMVEILIKPTSMAHNATYRMFLPHVQSFQFLEGLLLWSTWWSVTYATVRLTGIFLWAVLTSLKSQ